MAKGTPGISYIIQCLKVNKITIPYMVLIKLFSKWASLQHSSVTLCGLQSPFESEGNSWNIVPQGPELNASLLTSHPLPFPPFFLRKTTSSLHPHFWGLRKSRFTLKLFYNRPFHTYSPFNLYQGAFTGELIGTRWKKNRSQQLPTIQTKYFIRFQIEKMVVWTYFSINPPLSAKSQP